MKKKKPPIEKYPGNKWLVKELARLRIDATIPFVHGVIRGALTNPVGVHPALAFARICDKKNPRDLKTEDLEILEETMVLMHLHTTHAGRTGNLFSGGIRKGGNKIKFARKSGIKEILN